MTTPKATKPRKPSTMSSDPPSSLPEAKDSFARDQMTGLRGEFHEFREEIRGDVKGLATSLDEGLSRIYGQLNQDRRDHVNNLGQSKGTIMTLVFGVITIAMGFTTLITQPLRDKDARHTTRIDDQSELAIAQINSRIDEAKAVGALEATVDSLTDITRDLERDQERIETALLGSRERVSSLEGQLDMLNSQVDKVDSQGSRVWNSRGKAPR